MVKYDKGEGMDQLAVLFTDGIMTHGEVHKECQAGKWVPVLVYDDGNGKILPVFTDQETCKSFIKRNLPKNWNHGAVCLTDENMEFMKSKGVRLRIMSYPNKIPFEKMGFEILEFEKVPDFHVGYLKS